MKWLGLGLSIAALGISVEARADDTGPPPPVIVHSDAPPAPPPPPPTSEPPPPPAGQGVPPHVRLHHSTDESDFIEVHLDSDEPGTYLQALTEHEGWVALRGRWHTHFVYGRNVRWQPVCVAPCNMRVPPSLIYRIGGPTVTASDDFTLGAPGTSRTLHVDAGSRGQHTGGAVALVIGIPTAIVGLLLLGAGHDTRTAGFVTGGIGLGLVGLGAVLMATSNTTVTDDRGRVIGGLGPQGLFF